MKEGGGAEGECERERGVATMPHPWTLRLILNAAALKKQARTSRTGAARTNPRCRFIHKRKQRSAHESRRARAPARPRLARRELRAPLPWLLCLLFWDLRRVQTVGLEFGFRPRPGFRPPLSQLPGPCIVRNGNSIAFGSCIFITPFHFTPHFTTYFYYPFRFYHSLYYLFYYLLYLLRIIYI